MTRLVTLCVRPASTSHFRSVFIHNEISGKKRASTFPDNCHLCCVRCPWFPSGHFQTETHAHICSGFFDEHEDLDVGEANNDGREDFHESDDHDHVGILMQPVPRATEALDVKTGNEKIFQISHDFWQITLIV